MSELICLEHESNDGLKASVGGIRHGILVPVPVNLMQKAGTYYFVLHFKDSHADKYKDHQVKPALEMNSNGKFKKLAVVIDPGHGKFYDAKGTRDAQGDLPVRFRGGYHKISNSGQVYHEDWCVLVIGRRVKSFLDRKKASVRATKMTRNKDNGFDIDENAENIQNGCYEQDLIDNGIETCRLGFRAFDERCKIAKAFAAKYPKDEVVFVSVHTTKAGKLTLGGWVPRCFYIYWGEHPLVQDCHTLGESIVNVLTKIKQNAPTADSPEDRKYQVLWFSGFDLSKAKAEEFSDTIYEGRVLYSAADKAAIFSKWTGADEIYPAVIVECYSHDNDTWATILMDYDFRYALGDAIGQGILEYLNTKLKKQR